jgi:hypothetical protein
MAGPLSPKKPDVVVPA